MYSKYKFMQFFGNVFLKSTLVIENWKNENTSMWQILDVFRPNWVLSFTYYHLKICSYNLLK